MYPRRASEKITNDTGRIKLDHKLTAYLATSASLGAIAASEAQAVVVSNTTVQPFGINQEVNIDFNSDGQIDYQIDHDRVNLNGTNLDYLQIDKNDVSSAANPYPIDNFAVFPTNGTPANADHEYATDAGPGERGYYPSALLSGTEIGPLTNGWDFQEGENFLDSDLIIRANRLIDEDNTQIDDANPNPPPGVVGTFPPLGSPGWIGLGGQTRYLGMRIDLNDAGRSGFNNNASQYWYGWIGVRITNEADATGQVVGWGYENEVGMSILAGEAAPGPTGDFNGDGNVDAADYVVWRKNDGTPAGYNAWRTNFGATSAAGAVSVAGIHAVPEPHSLVLSLGAGIAVIGAFIYRKIRGS
ncbi:MAG: hypothetical protein WD738_23310 [Pirellulales bacterium]